MLQQDQECRPGLIWRKRHRILTVAMKALTLTGIIDELAVPEMS